MKQTNSANWILVTGTSSGIGRAATFTLAENAKCDHQRLRLATHSAGG